MSISSSAAISATTTTFTITANAKVAQKNYLNWFYAVFESFLIFFLLNLVYFVKLMRDFSLFLLSASINIARNGLGCCFFY